MADNMKLWVNGQEIPVPKELQGLMKMAFPPMIQPQPPIMKRLEKPTKVLCRDTYLRKVVIDLNMRVLELEKKLGKKEVKVNKPKVITKKNINPKQKKVDKKINPKQKKGSVVKKKTSKTKKTRM